MKYVALILIGLMGSQAFASTRGLGTSEVHAMNEPGYSMVTVDIKGDAAKVMFNQFVRWGFQQFRCSDENRPFGPISINGQGFACQKDGNEYSCSSIVNRDYISPNYLACPAPSGGVGSGRN